MSKKANRAAPKKADATPIEKQANPRKVRLVIPDNDGGVAGEYHAWRAEAGDEVCHFPTAAEAKAWLKEQKPARRAPSREHRRAAKKILSAMDRLKEAAELFGSEDQVLIGLIRDAWEMVGGVLAHQTVAEIVEHIEAEQDLKF